MANEQDLAAGSGVMEFDPVPNDVEDTDDGGAIVRMGEDEQAQEEKNWFDNIADELEQNALDTLAVRLLEDIERDKQTRKERDNQYAQAIRRTGLSDDAPGHADFEGASKAVHPMLTQACIDYAARAIRELMPPNGPVRIYIPGDPTPDRVDKAERKKEYMNWQFKTQMPDFHTELEQCLTQTGLAGSQYMRIVYDQRKRRPVPVFVPSDDVYLPYSASNFYTAERITYCEYITQFEFDQRVKAGIYIKPNEVTTVTGQVPDVSAAEKQSQKIEGKTPNADGYNKDGLRVVYEVTTYCDLEEGVEGAPYRITIDGPSHKVVAVNRNWEQDDEAMESLYWMVEFPFVPWRGPYSIGLGQIAGALAGAATGALNALLDSAHINNLPTLLRLKGANFTGQTKELNVADVTEIEGSMNADDIRKLVMAVPYNPPSAALFQLLGFLTEAGQSIIRTSMENVAEGHPNMPVGTTLALIEEGMKVMSAIHLRTYRSMDYVIRLIHRINRMYLTDDEIAEELGDPVAKAADFDLPLDVIPTADPEVFSDMQRIAQLQIVADRAAAMPHLYNQRKVEERLLERTKIPNPEELLAPENTPEEQNAVNENAAMSLGRPVAAFPQQDHLAHLQVHLDYMQSPVLGRLPIIAPKFYPMVLEHIAEHVALWYVHENFQLLKMSTQKDDEQIAEMLKHQDPETRAELDRTLAAASQKIVPRASQILSGIPPIVQQAIQMLQQMAPKPQIPVDPNKQAALEQKEASDQRKVQAQRETAQLRLVDSRERRASEREKTFAQLSAREREQAVKEAAEEARQAQEHAARLKELMLSESAEDERLSAELASRESINVQDNMTALAISEAEIESGEKVAVETGKGINPSA